MKTEVECKLASELADLPINSEARVVYILVQIRKLLDHNGNSHPIRFYCNWALHTELVKKPAQDWLLKLSNMTDSQVIQVVSLKDLKKLSKDYLTNNNLNTDLTDVDDNWSSFHKHLVNILIDTPIASHHSSISYLALEKRGAQDVGGVNPVKYKLVKDGNTHLGNIYPF